MNLSSPWALLLLIPVAAWTMREWSTSPRRLGLLLKALAVACVCLALARPQWLILETYSAVAILADASHSVPDDQAASQRQYLAIAAASGGAHVVRDLEFGARPARSLPRDLQASTNLEAAVRDALGILPADRVPRLVLSSDGLASEGAVERAVHHAWLRKIPIDTVALPGRPNPHLRVTGLRIPARAYAGERFPIEFEVESPAEGSARLRLSAEGRTIGTASLLLSKGRTSVTARARIDSPGATLIEGLLTTEAGGDLRFAGAVAIREPQALLISPDTAEQNGPLSSVLSAAGFRIDRSEGTGPLVGGEPEADVVVCSNSDFEAWPADAKQRMADFVQGGGGFLLIAGERNLYKERTDGESDPLHEMLPATLAPPRTPEGTAVVLVVDKSSSMEGKKMQLARQSAVGVVENLRTIDSVGVLAFDNSFEWAAPLQRNHQPEATTRLISGIVADGGTQIAPALSEAFRMIQPQRAVYKHILLLTDGISEEGDSIALAREAAANDVTISTIGLGQDVNRSYLERVARSAEGQSYFLLDIMSLEQIVLRDVMEHTGTSVTEREFLPRIERDLEILEGLDFAEPGPLLGWVKFEAKRDAETILLVEEEDPLLVRWQYGLGRAAVFTSDAKHRWATNWVPWGGFDTFWSNIARDILPRSSGTEVETSFDVATGEIVVRYLPRTPSPETEAPEIFALGPEGYRQVSVPKPLEGGYEARFPAAGHFGLFRIRPESRSRAFPEAAHYRENTELTRFGSDEALLRTIAVATGGRVNPPPEELFSTGGRSVQRWMDLWPLLLALAILLNLVEVAARKGWLPWLGRWA